MAGPVGVTVDGDGNLVIADSGNGRIRVVAGRTGTFYGRAMTAGDIYSIAGDGSTAYAGDGGPATSAGIDPESVSLDQAGNLVMADMVNDRIRVVAEHTGTFYRQAMTAGDIYTVAGDGTEGFAGDGGPATAAELAHPTDVVVDDAGNLVIADQFSNRVRVVAEREGTFYGQPMTAGDIYTVAGDGTTGFAGDAGPGPAAELASPEGVAVTAAGQLLIADTVNNRIRQLAG
jgi:sugar lactone lactonase YvrE